MSKDNSKLYEGNPEDLHKLKNNLDKQVGDTWDMSQQRQQSPLVSKEQRKTGAISDDANSKLRQGQQPTNI
jgi:hypothetical protein